MCHCILFDHLCPCIQGSIRPRLRFLLLWKVQQRTRLEGCCKEWKQCRRQTFLWNIQCKHDCCLLLNEILVHRADTMLVPFHFVRNRRGMICMFVGACRFETILDRIAGISFLLCCWCTCLEHMANNFLAPLRFDAILKGSHRTQNCRRRLQHGTGHNHTQNSWHHNDLLHNFDKKLLPRLGLLYQPDTGSTELI